MMWMGDGAPAGPVDRGRVRVVVTCARRPVAGPDRGVPGPAGPADERRRADRGGRVGAVDRLPAFEDPHRGPVRARRAGRYRPALPHQRAVHRLLPVRRRCRDGQTGPGRPVGFDRRPPMTVTVRAMDAADADAVLAIYQICLDSGDASFEVTAPTWTAYDRARLPGHRFVATDDLGTVVGWTAVSPVSARPVYRGVVEHSVYVDPAVQGRGVGRALLDALIASTEAAGIWTIQS